MSSAIYSTQSTGVTLSQGRARRLLSASRSLLERRGISDVAGVISGLGFVLARVPLYAVAVLFAGAACIAGVLLYAIRTVVRRMAGGAQEIEVATSPDPQSLAVGGSRG